MAELKTRLTTTSPADFIGKVDDERRRKDCRELIAMMRAATGKPPRKQDLVLYLGPGLENGHLLAKLGKHRTGKGCLY